MSDNEESVLFSHPLRRILLQLALVASAVGQSDTGELRLLVKDAAGGGMAATVELVNRAANNRQTVTVPNSGRYSFKNLPLGDYRLLITHPGFAASSELVEIRSALPLYREITLQVQALQTSVTVTEADTLVDFTRTNSASYIGAAAIRERPSGMPGRGLLDMIVMQPGWSFEANGVLHPRGSEYDTQFVVNGIPVYDNRSPAFAPIVDTDNIESVKTFTSGIPAEYGQKLGGVVEINTQRNTSPGFHGAAAAQGGSFGTYGGFISGQYVAGRTSATLAAHGFSTERYLDPPAVANLSNHGSSSSFTAALERDVNDANRVRVSFTRQQTWFLVPNTLLEQAVGQRQDRTSANAEGQVFYQHVFAPSVIGSVSGMARDVNARLWSNPSSTPIFVHQDRGFREGYLKAAVAAHQGRHEWKAGVEARFAQLDESFGHRIITYRIDPGNVRVFSSRVPASFEFTGSSADHEQALFVQDTIRVSKSFTLSAGLRFDHYSLLVDEMAVSPRIAAAWSHQPAGLVLHAAYDRTFGTPAFENLLLSSSPASRFGFGAQLPVPPSHGNYYEAGITQALGRHVRLDASYFRREIDNAADDNLLLNTGVSFPITFHHASIRGVEVKLEAPKWGPFSGFLSYSNTLGAGQFPLSGGLFFDSDEIALINSTERFRISQDIRNRAGGLVRYQVLPRLWTAWSATYSSGLPVENVEDLPNRTFLAAQYGDDVLAKVNFARERVTPSFAVNASFGADMWRRETRSVSVQADVMNLTDRLNLINFAGLLSGTAVAPPRSFGVRLRADF